MCTGQIMEIPWSVSFLIIGCDEKRSSDQQNNRLKPCPKSKWLISDLGIGIYIWKAPHGRPDIWSIIKLLCDVNKKIELGSVTRLLMSISSDQSFQFNSIKCFISDSMFLHIIDP